MARVILGGTALRRWREFCAAEGGATAVEYGVMVALISVAITTTVFTLGTSIKTTLYEQIVNALANMME